MNEERVGVLDYFLVLTRWWKLIALSFITACILAFAVGSIVPKWYRATATIFPPKSELSALGLSSLTQNLPLGALGFKPGADESLVYLAILQSRTVMELVAKRFNLQQVYGARNLERTVRALRANVDLGIDREGTIHISVLDKSPKRAADIANAFVAFLDSLNRRRKVESARNNRIFIEKRYLQCKRDLRAAEDSLRAFQEKYGAIALPEQTELAIKSAADLYADITRVQIELGIKRRHLQPQHQEIVALQDRLKALQRKLREFQYGQTRVSGTDGLGKRDELFVPFADVPQVGLLYARLLREVQIQSKIFELLTTYYEQAKLQEARDTPTVQVLDAAIPPIHKARPKRLIWMLVAGSVTLLVTVMFAFTAEYVGRIMKRGGPEAEKLLAIKSILLHPFTRSRQ